MNTSISTNEYACFKQLADQMIDNNRTFLALDLCLPRTISNDLALPPTFESPL